jgi:hypothetical protein
VNEGTDANWVPERGSCSGNGITKGRTV